MLTFTNTDAYKLRYIYMKNTYKKTFYLLKSLYKLDNRL